MKKVININFQSRVIPIEETAYDLLKTYIDSLKRYFNKEEGSQEIIEDIESRIAELFSERLKRGINCITDADVNEVIAGMGRPEDFAAVDGEPGLTEKTRPAFTQEQSHGNSAKGGRLYRNADDKILAGVASGLANYLGIDPVITRIVFVLFFGVLFWVYLLLWIVVPSRSVQTLITKRLYRSPDQRVLGGVAGGLASYFNIDVWIPRLIFALPFILAVVSGPFEFFWWDVPWPRIFSGSFGGTLFLTYIILWISVPVAHTAAEKLEMKGEKVDLNSIASTVKEDLQQFRDKAGKWGEEVKTSARDLGQKTGNEVKSFTSDISSSARNSRSGLGHAVGVLAKAFFLLIFASLSVILFSIFIAILFGGVALSPLMDYVFESSIREWQVWTALFFFFMIPLIALMTYVVRRIVGVRSQRHYLGYFFGALWLVGMVSVIALALSVIAEFRHSHLLQEEKLGSVENTAKLQVAVEGSDWKQFNNRFFGMEVDSDFPFYTVSDDSMMVNTVGLSMAKSPDSLYHVYMVRESRGGSIREAAGKAEKIEFRPTINNGNIIIPEGFVLGKKEKYRGQRVHVIFEMPVGGMITFDRNIERLHWFSFNDHNDRYGHGEYNEWRNVYNPEPGSTFMMTEKGRPERIYR